MNKRTAMSNMGYAIVSVIVLGIIMIVSAPLIVDNTKKTGNTEPQQNAEQDYRNDDYSELREIESRLSSRIDDLERRQSAQQQGNSVINKYVCTLEGTVDESGNVVPLENPSRGEKIVFVCEYRQ